MNSLVIMLVSVVVLVCGYLFYGRWLAKQWGVDPSKETPAHTMADGNDYCAAKAPVLLGHHFASIAGAGPINGPIQAAIFGWVPVLLWILIGGVFFGATHDFASLFASIRHEGKSIGHVIEVNIGRRGKKLFLVFAYLTLLLVVAAFGSIVVGTFASGAEGTEAFSVANGRTAMISMLFIVLAIVFGFLVYRRNAPLGVSTVVGVVALVACIVIGYNVPIHMGAGFWSIFVMVYILIASVTPVWILLQPRDYLNSFLLYGMLALAVIGVVVAHPVVALPAFTGFGGIKGDSMLFPVLFITVACGAISGFHSLVGSGTTAKQLDNEKDAMAIGYGGMLIECALAVISLICVGILFADGAMPAGTPTVVFATGVSTMLQAVGLPYDVMYSVIILSVSAFCLTSLDTATRLARYMLQEFFVDEGTDPATLTGVKKALANPFVATLITVILGGILMTGGYSLIWPLFGAANQLLAALALLACAAWLGNIGKNNKMFYIPMVFMLLATLTSLAITFKTKIASLMAGSATVAADVLQTIFSGVLFVLAIVLVVEGFKALSNKKAAASK
ncbi:carbon starvation protein A [uncultured Oscillibacter sp.]|uniref:carbon starvation CstA family protein n=1 Tax=uncultured Oscillibacter sp. TaxID=876091 RepID=UPI0025E3243B|nr:carbon starvation protein A [uncultured Oscillibacter sp.]